MKANPLSPDFGAANTQQFLIAGMRRDPEIANHKSQIGNSRAPWAGDWRLAIAEERVAMAEARLREAEERMKNVR